jgi:hypothetical protein
MLPILIMASREAFLEGLEIAQIGAPQLDARGA